MDWNGCLSIMQGYLENSPLVVLGSGASIPYGLPSMGDLATYIKSNSTVMSDPNYGAFCEALNSEGLEKAIDSVHLNDATLDAIRITTWENVNNSDLNFIRCSAFSPPQSLIKLFEKVIAPTPNKAIVVTTNYDRLPDYAADGIGASSITGFEGSYIKKLELPNDSVSAKRVRARERIVEIWKVHGSLDWFTDAKGDIYSFPLSQDIPAGFSPLIVPPGKNKYSTTHNEPYRSVISEADKAFTTAGAYLCVGYGFNDEHIQPKLLTQIANGKPVVVLARTMTAACKSHIIDAGIKKYLIFEKSDDSHTTVYGNGWSETYEGQYWCLDEFLKVW